MGERYDHQPMLMVYHSPKSKVSGIAEVAFPQFVLFYSQRPLQNFICFSSTYCHMDRYLLISPDAEGSNGVAGLA